MGAAVLVITQQQQIYKYLSSFSPRLSWRGWAWCGARSYSYERHLGGRNCAGLFGVYIRRDIIVAQSAVIGIDKPNSASAQLFIFHTYLFFFIILRAAIPTL